MSAQKKPASESESESGQKTNRRGNYSTVIDRIKQQAKGDWQAILGLSPEVCDGQGHPCPQCDGTDRFHTDSDFANNGKLYCRGCLPRGASDGIAAYAWRNDLDNSQAIKALAERFGIVGDEKPKVDLIGELCRNKRMPIDAFMQFNPEIKKRNRTGYVRVPVYDGRGEAHSYFDMLPNAKGWFARGQGMQGVFLPGRKPSKGETWHLCEGVKDASALIGIGCNAAGMPMSFLASKYAELFRDCHIILVPDLDTPGQNGAQKTGGNLFGIAASIRVARLPGEIKESNGEDIRDVLSRPDGKQIVLDAITEAELWKPREGGHDTKDGRPEVLVTLAEGYVADQVVKYLGKLGWESPWIPSHLMESVKVFHRGGLLVAAMESEDPIAPKGTLRLIPLSEAITRERITQACQLMQERETAEGDIERYAVPPPPWSIKAIHQRGWFGGNIRPLTGIVQAPTIRQDGSILQKPGYDRATGLIYAPLQSFPIVPSDPTKADALEAAKKLIDVVRDFPLQSDADRAAWLAMVLSMIARQCVSGCVPLFAVTANIRGAGKSLLVDAGSLIAFGRTASRRPFPPDENELRKTITTIVLEATQAVLFDNLACKLQGASLDAALTATIWQDRILGSSTSTGELPIKTVWAATGNNLLFGSDIARRVIPIRLESELENPEERTGFAHPDLLGYVSTNRAELAAEALTIVRAFYVAGCPVQLGGNFGSFEGWTNTIRASLVWLGIGDPLETRETAKGSDDSAELLRLLIYGLLEADPEREGLTTKQIERLTGHRQDETPSCPTLLEAVSEVCGDRFNAKSFGRKLRSFQGRTIDGMQIRSENAGKGVKKWRVVPSKGGLGGEGGFDFPESAGGTRNTPRDDAHTHGCDTHTHRDSGGANPHSPPNQPSKVCQCGAEMVPSEEINGWRNWDCPKCKAVKPERVQSC